MRFKAPGGDLNWLTPLLFLAGGFLGIHSIVDQGINVIAVIYLTLAIGALLVWFDQRWVALPFIALFGLGVIGGVGLILVNGFTWRMAMKTALAAYNIYSFWEWMQREPDDSEIIRQLEAEAEFGDTSGADGIAGEDPEQWWQPKKPHRD